MYNHASVTNIKMLYHTADFVVEETRKFSIISPIESNFEAKTQIKSNKSSERIKLLAKIRVQRKDLSKKKNFYRC